VGPVKIAGKVYECIAVEGTLDARPTIHAGETIGLLLKGGGMVLSAQVRTMSRAAAGPTWRSGGCQVGLGRLSCFPKRKRNALTPGQSNDVRHRG
jgi:hypothetical protein